MLTPIQCTTLEYNIFWSHFIYQVYSRVLTLSSLQKEQVLQFYNAATRTE